MNIDHIHFYVENALASGEWFVKQMGFQAIASGASSHTCTTVVKSGAVHIVLSSPLSSKSPIAQFLRLHPPGVVDIAFAVSDLESVMERLVQKGAKLSQPIQTHYFAQGYLKWGKIAAWGVLSHTIIERLGISPIPAFPAQVEGSGDNTTRHREALGVGGEQMTADPSRIGSGEKDAGMIVPDVGTKTNNPQPTLFTDIDHIVLNVTAGDLVRAMQWYQDILGFQPQERFTIQTEQSGLSSQVMVHPETGVQFPINEPTSANSQIQEFLNLNGGPGIQHIALATDHIVPAIAQLRTNGLSFIDVPKSYYTQIRQRYPNSNLSLSQWQEIADQKILVDWQENSPHALLLQTFTQPIFPQPTFFFEIIERRLHAQGFGEGNFRALFEAIEREQLKRGSLEIK